ncbi:LLM class F420-dependent oxidoreductase [Nocardioides immobilis]|uniref:LLM class F420-dependent oxidoreductase n=2 Tax=Nocardioides immobilis TaxID=2049295 RepID=A0A417XTW8_9ACTN|nr:LLM class F420-dependent oxidoreductase [Nocardioides immobilis]
MFTCKFRTVTYYISVTPSGNDTPSGIFGDLGVWLLRHLPSDVLINVSRQSEDLGYGTVWIAGGVEPGVFDVIEKVLDATERITVATGIVNLWAETPETVTRAWHHLEERHPGRLYVGLGISHAPLVEQLMNVEYSKPLAKTKLFLDELDAQADPLPPSRRLIGALGPKMLELAAERTMGAHPYRVSTRSTAQARELLGDAFLAPELGAILEPDLDAARAIGRSSIEYYLQLPNYTNNWLRSGFTADDFSHGGSDRLIDALFALGDVDAIAARVKEHRAAGADHVAFQVLGDDPDRIAVLRVLAHI